MAQYEYKCKNDKCKEYDIKKVIDIPITEYSSDKLPICERCGEKTQRVYGISGHQTFGDGYKG